MKTMRERSMNGRKLVNNEEQLISKEGNKGGYEGNEYWKGRWSRWHTSTCLIKENKKKTPTTLNTILKNRIQSSSLTLY